MSFSPAHLTTLSNCDREPIHAPGGIQPHGFLLLLDTPALTIAGTSTNVRDLFWREAQALIGTPVAELLGLPVGDSLTRARGRPEFTRQAQFIGHATLNTAGEAQVYSLVAHGLGDLIVLEGEPAPKLAPLQGEQELQTFLTRLAETESLHELQQMAVAEVRRITGFDRCLLYRFDADWNGTVIAEDGNGALPSYLHHHFPAADIPRPARELYRRNRLRLIPTHAYRPVSIIGSAKLPSVHSLDLSLSVLRSVSPIHLEYMRNMGTGSSMSISLLRGGELWGLISCHSRDPRFIPLATRTACDLVGQFLSLQLAAREQTQELAFRVELTTVLTRLLSDVARSWDFGDAEVGADLMRLARAEGVAIVTADAVVRHGRTPDEGLVRSLADWVRQSGRDLVASDRLGQDFPPAAEAGAEASGLLAVDTAPAGLSLLWFRPELVQVVEWGGEPVKDLAGAGGGRELHPRRSFDTWRETVRGRAQPFEAAVIASVKELRRALAALSAAPRAQPAATKRAASKVRPRRS